MSFSSDLLDGFDLLNKRTDGVLKTVSSVAEFFHKLSELEKDYSKSVASLVSKQKQAFQKASSSQKELATTFSGWDSILNELQKISDHHKQYSDKLDNDLAKPIEKWAKDKQTNKKKLESDSEKITKEMKKQLDNLKSVRSKYVTLSKEADSAESTHTKGKGDINMKPQQLAKLAAKASQTADKAALADNEYQQTLSLTNQKQSEYYLTTQPALLSEFQQFEEDRLQYMKSMLEKFADIHSEKPTFYTNCCETISSAASSIKIDSDISAFVGENKTGVSAPADIPYVPYDSEAPAVPSSSKPKPARPVKAAKPPPYKGPAPDPISSKDWGLGPSDKHSSEEDQRNKLAGQLDELEKLITKEKKTKDGLENLIRFYASDPVAQKKAEDELRESEQKTGKLEDIRNNVYSQLEKLGGAPSGRSTSSGGGGSGMRVRGLYDYTATCDTELSFKEGDVLAVTEQDDSGWWYAELHGQSGFVPNNYVEVI